MRKSNIAIVAVLVVASISLLAMWVGLGLDLLKTPAMLVIIVIWWVLIAAVCVLLSVAERRRRERIRTTYLSEEALYNSETGLVRVAGSDGVSRMNALRLVLSNLRYNDAMVETPTDAHVRFGYIVRSPKFAQEGAVWEGEVIKLSPPKFQATFTNADELANCLSVNYSA